MGISNRNFSAVFLGSIYVLSRATAWNDEDLLSVCTVIALAAWLIPFCVLAMIWVMSASRK